MLLDTYKAQELMWLITINAKTKSGQYAFRGDLIVKLGEFNEVANKRNPPEAVIKEAVILADDTSLLMVVGNFSDILELPEFISRFTADLAPDCKPLFFVDNLKESVVVDVEGRSYTLIPLPSGMVWNELLDLCYLDKHDLKGQSTEDKVVTVYNALKSYQPKFKTATLDEAITSRTDVKREVWGAV
ncbi:MAG TPA: hypothetical protein PLE99_17395 [Candidatus Thiothrix moscowensis]|uniref:hypothetical protein n=1 Tax=unclassified Thiothrix TaxID=2636184 RepID=UPI0025E6F8FB|nr:MULTISPECIES: hypothetical protein [unclassified Thiothrix]HRJ54540.1 hypothetical protein [Candidatus Thiothrix moscowensis]HRJ94892.1 hypothetical protein [Candidatus Thiothrix moscowensis]